MCLFRENRSISPVIGAVLLIAITIVLVGIIAAFAGRTGLPPAPVNCFLRVEGDGVGNTSFLIKHSGGDTVSNAFGSGLADLDVRINGASVKGRAFLSLNGEGITKSDFETGDLLWVIGPELNRGDTVTVVYEQTNQTLVERGVRTTKAKTLPPCCVLELSFEEGSGTMASDTSGNGNHGTLRANAGALPSWVSGKYGSALEFGPPPTDNNLVEVPYSTSLSPDTYFTVEAWGYVKTLPPSYKDHVPIVWRGNNIGWGNDYHFRIAIRRDGSATWGSGGQDGSEYWFDAGSIELNRWHYFVYVADGTDLRAYVDFNEVGTRTGNPPYMVADYSTWMGWSNRNGADVYIDGVIDEVRIYDRALIPA